MTDTQMTQAETQNVHTTDLATLTVEIKFHLQQTGYHIIKAGYLLNIAKEKVKHGEWASWLESNFALSQSTAERFMKVANRFGVNSSTSKNFKTSQMVEMLALPAGEEEDFIAAKKAEGTPVEGMTVKKLREEIKYWKQQTEDAENRVAKAAETINELEERVDARDGQLETAFEEARKFRKNYEAEAGRVSGLLEECADLREDLDLANNEIDKLKTATAPRTKVVAPADYEDLKREVKELRERPVEVAVEKPADYDALKQENANLKAREQEFKGTLEIFEIFRTKFHTLEVSYLQTKNVTDLKRNFKNLIAEMENRISIIVES